MMLHKDDKANSRVLKTQPNIVLGTDCKFCFGHLASIENIVLGRLPLFLFCL
jgi:hypothetical protein